MLRNIATIALAALLTGCTAAGSATKAVVDRTTLASGWRVDCRDDAFRAERTCFAGTFGETRHHLKYFQIQFVNGAGPRLFVPHDFPGRTPTVRVDDGPVLSDPARIVEAMRTGRTAFVAFHVWPTGEERMTLQTAGFSEAYDRLLTMK